MSEHGKQQLTGSERLQRRITLADILTGAAIALWLVPVALVIVNVPHDILTLVVALASTLGLSTFLMGVVLRSRQADRRWKEKADQTMLRRHNELVTQIANNHLVLTRMVDHTQSAVDNGLASVFEQLNVISGQLARKSWDIYADAITDLNGGPEVVNGQDTRRLQAPVPRPGPSNVVKFPPTANSSKNGGF